MKRYSSPRSSRAAHSARSPRSSRSSRSGPLVAFLLIASFGILFAGCGPIQGPEAVEPEEFTFTEEDAMRFQELANEGEDAVPLTGTKVLLSVGGLTSTGTSPLDLPSPEALDLTLADTYEALRADTTGGTADTYRVTNEFVNIRSQPSVTSPLLERLEQGAALTLVEFVNAAWAKVSMAGGKQGYVSSRYIAKVTSDDRLAEEKKVFEGLYYVNFGFVNVRKDPDAQSEKLGELPGQAFVRPLSTDAVWARVPFEGKEGYVAIQYLSPFSPGFLVRQERYTLPILHYNIAEQGVIDAISRNVDALKRGGYRIITLRDFYDLVLRQELRDVRLDPKSVVIAVSGITPENVRALSDALNAKNVRATLFLQTQHLNLSGITEKTILTLVANGFDIQSGTHTGDDLRSLVDQRLALELEQSRAILEEMTKKPVFAIAYPQGGVNIRVMELAKKAGYLFGIALPDPAKPKNTLTRAEFLSSPGTPVSSTLSDEEFLVLVQ
ncbi:MAG: SH3 domain-containing protein [Candidatus Peregrinibacteria bacterium]|nr:SH3 domain-containing protein [Candidatus Peregrinibacteria bacterium]